MNESDPVSAPNVVGLKRAPSATLIQTLETLLQEARSGELCGAVIWCNNGDTYNHYTAGHIQFQTMLLALESWKFNQFAHRELERVDV